MKEADHIREFRLFEFARAESAGEGVPLEESEKEHLHQCAECGGVVEVFRNQLKRQPTPSSAGVPIRRFNVGDTVEIIGPGAHKGKRGVVTHVVEPKTGDFVYRYQVQFTDDVSDTFFGFELEWTA
jgi:transcription antitermination factor NusG